MWVLADIYAIPVRYLSDWYKNGSPIYGPLDRAIKFDGVGLAIAFLIDRTYCAGGSGAGYNSGFRPAKLKRVVTFEPTLIGDLVDGDGGDDV